MITIFNIRPKGFNVGNNAINMGLQYYLYQAFEELVNIITLPATSRYESYGDAGLTARTIHEINQYGHGVIIGGGNLYENGELEINPNALKALDVPLMLFSLSWGRVYNRRLELVERSDSLPENLIALLNMKAQFSLARDKATYAYLQRIGCKNVQIGGCPTIFLDRIAYRLPKLPDQEKGEVLISIRNPQLMNIPLSKQAQISSDLINIINFLRNSGHKRISLLCHDYRDIRFAASIPGIDYIYTGDVYSFLALLKMCSLNITYRLHSALPCMAFDRPFIKISYDERGNSLMDTIGFDEWNIKMFETANVFEQVKNRYSRLHELPLIKAKARPIWDSLDCGMIEIFKKFAISVLEYKSKIEKAN